MSNENRYQPDRAAAARAVGVLNEALEADPVAVAALVKHRVPCHAELGDHPSVQCRREADGSITVGALGLINGLFGVDVDQYGLIEAVFDTDTGRVHRFVLRDAP